jgi:eukaryotic-like serine/threonine-protein kinase
VIHQDLKPSNVLVSHSSRTKITDFGMAKLAARNGDDAGMLVGAMEYMAPEQFLGRPIGERCDIHASGTILYQLLTGKSPFADAHNFAMPKVLNWTPPPPSSVKDGLTAAFDRVVARALAKAPADRFASARAFKDDLCVAYAALRGRMPPETLAPVTSAAHSVASDPDATRPFVGMAAAPPAATRGMPPGAQSAPSPAARGSPLPGRSEYQRGPGSVGEAATAHVSSLAASDAAAPLARRAGMELAAATAMLDLPERAPASVPPKGPPVDVGRDSTRPAAAPSQPPDVVAPVAAEGGRAQAIRGATPSPVSGQPVSRRGVPVSSAGRKPLTEASIALGGRVLARFIGPIAIIYSRKAAQDAHNERAYLERLAAHLADPRERADFFRALRHPS